MYKLTRLDSGLTVITNRMADAHSLALGLWIKTGGRYENKSMQGVSHFMEHMLFKGTRRRTCQQLKQDIEKRGGVFNAFTAEECVCYYVKILSEHIELASDVLTDMVLNSTFDNKELEKERKVIFEEIRMYLDLPMNYVHDLLDGLLWPKHPLGLSLVGTYDTVKSIGRKEMLERKERFHTPDNIFAVCCGDIEHDRFVDIMSSHFKNKKPGKKPSFLKAGQSFQGPKTHFFHKDTEQTHLCLGVRALSRQHPQRHALGVLNTILGGNMSSRLFNEIREKRSLAYEIGSSVKQYYDTGSFYIHAGIDNKKVPDAIAIMMKELKKVKKAAVSQAEIEMAKEYYRSGLLMMLEATMSNMLFLGEQMTSVGRILTRDDILRELEKVDRAMVRDVANKIFTDNGLKLAVIGPQAEEDKKEIGELLYF